MFDKDNKVGKSAFLPLGMMLTEEMYKANFILDRWLKRGANKEDAAQPENGLDLGQSGEKRQEGISTKSGKEDERMNKEQDHEDDEDENDNDDDFNQRNDDNDDNNDDNDGGVMMPIPDVSF
jgi:hypothetical protein